MNTDNFVKGMLFSDLTTLKIGGPINYYIEIDSSKELKQSLELCQLEKLQSFVIGGGSNLLVADEGFNGVVIKNNIQSIEKVGKEIIVGAGTVLQDFINWANQKGYAGFEKLAGIPGTVGGAVYGNAGAYGQTISDNMVWVEVINTENLEIEKLNKSACEFAYRESKFKHSASVITKAAFRTLNADPNNLIKTSSEVIAMREQKYSPRIKCPGSFFKNVEVSILLPSVLAGIPKDKIMYGKIPAGWLLESVGAKGDKQGDIQIAPQHGNLFLNTGNGTAKDFAALAEKYQQKVYERFGIMLEPEVQLVGFKETQDQISYFEMAPRGRPTEKNILLLHGWGAYKEKLKPLAEKLKTNGWYVVAVDMPGFGQTSSPKRVFSVKDFAKVINGFTEKKFGSNGFFVFGHSFGGRVAVNLAIMNPNVRGIVLCATSGLVRPHIIKRIIFLILAKIGKAFLAIPGAEFLARLWREMLYKTAREHDYEKAQGIMRYVFRNIVADSIRPLLPNLQIPVLLLWGEEDKQTPLKSAYLAKSLINRPMLKVFANVGHALPYKRPAELARQITIWSKTFLS